MEIRAERVGVDGPHGPLLRPTSVRVRDGEVVLVTGEPGAGHTSLALALGGRIRPNHGTVTLDGQTDLAKLRKIVALVDAPSVNEPEDGLRLRDAVAEELMAGRKQAERWLTDQAAGGYAQARVENVPADVRTRLLTELAATRPGVRALMIDTPDRHTSNHGTWWPVATRMAERGLAVVVLVEPAAAAAVPLTPAFLGDPQ